jgi:hypothetical protein
MQKLLRFEQDKNPKPKKHESYSNPDPFVYWLHYMAATKSNEHQRKGV